MITIYRQRIRKRYRYFLCYFEILKRFLNLANLPVIPIFK